MSLPNMPKVLNSIRMGSDRIKNIVLGLRNFSRLDESAQKPVDLHEGIANTLMILNHRLVSKAIALLLKFTKCTVNCL